MTTAAVQDKRETVKRWASYLSSDESVSTTRKYLLASESDVARAKGFRPALSNSKASDA